MVQASNFIKTNRETLLQLVQGKALFFFVVSVSVLQDAYKICNYIYISLSLSQNASELQGLSCKHTSVSEHQYASTHNQSKTLISYTPTNRISLIFIVLAKNQYGTVQLYCIWEGEGGYSCSHTTMEWLACSMHVCSIPSRRDT